MQITQEKTYKCPVCNGNMIFKSGTDKYSSFYCEICDTLLQIEMREKLHKVFMGKNEILVEDKIVADILKRGTKNETNEFGSIKRCA